MTYIVVYQRADGSSGLEECTDLELAVVAAERLRNVDDVESPRIFKTEEVHFDFRPYYRVEVARETDPVVSAPLEAAPIPDVALDPWAEVEIPPALLAPPVDRVADVDPTAVPVEVAAEIPAEADVTPSDRQFPFEPKPVAAAVAVLAIVLILSGLTSSQWEASALVGADSFEINRARIPRTAAGLVRDSRVTVDSDATVQPIEETGLILVRVVDTDRARAEADLDTLVTVVLEDLNAVGDGVASFVQVTDATVRTRTAGLRLSDGLFFLTLATLAFGLAGFGVVSYAAHDTPRSTDEPS